MKKSIIKLIINNTKYLTLEMMGPVEEVYLFDDITIVYHDARKQYVLYTKDFVCEALRGFESVLKLALNNQLTLHESIQEDIGFLWAEYLQRKENHIFIEEPLENSSCWVGLNYHLFEYKEYDTWLYNKDGEIYLKITPSYQWHFDEPQKNENFIPYEEFIKNYKPLVILKIDKEQAEEWLKIVSNLVAIAEKNYQLWSKTAAEG